jgi:hypothetical protein
MSSTQKTAGHWPSSRWRWPAIPLLIGVSVLGGWLYSLTHDEPLPPIPDGLESRMKGCIFPVRVVSPIAADPGRESVEYGSCVAVPGQGLLLTAAHLFRDADPAMRTTILVDGHELAATIMAVDPSIDAALLHVADFEGDAISLADRSPQPGIPAFIFGYPVEYSGATLPMLIGTRGRIVDPRHSLATPDGAAIPVIRLRGSTHFGGSGGAVVDREGALIGLTHAAQFASSARRQSTDVFAIPADRLRAFLQGHATRVELGPDPDGDMLVGMNDQSPLVADLPDPRITFSDIEFGLRVDVEDQNTRDSLILRKQDLSERRVESGTQVDEVMQRRIAQRTDYRGGGITQAGPLMLPISYGQTNLQQIDSEERRHSVTYTVSRERLEQVSQSWQVAIRSTLKEKIASDAGYFQAIAHFSNPSSTACRLEDFDITIRVDDRPRWTFSARQAARFSPRTLANSNGAQDIAVLRFDRISTREIADLPIGPGQLAITFEVASSSIRLTEDDRVGTLSRRLTSIRSKCASVEIVAGGESRGFHISTVTGGDTDGIPLSELLSERVPHRAGVAWGIGPLGDYLAEFSGRRGVAVLTPNRFDEGRWLVSRGQVELSGNFRNTLIRPGDRIRVQFLTGEQYWGDLVGFTGYVVGYQELRQLWNLERNFWAELEGYNQSPGKPWDALAKQKTRDQARDLHRRYLAFFSKPETSPALRRVYPEVEARIRRFAEWFSGDDLNLPSYMLTLRGARVWWNLDVKLQPTFVARCNGVEVRGDQRTLSPKGGSAEVKVAGGTTSDPPPALPWSPFDTIEFRLWNDGVLDEDLRYIQVKDFFGPCQLIGRQPLDRSDAERNLSGVELIWEIRDHDTLVRSDEFRAHLDTAKPRVLGTVPTARLRPEILAHDYWVEHNPASYYRAATLFEELYRSRKGSSDELGLLSLAMLGYFRALAFERCMELAANLPTADDLPPKVAEQLPDGIDIGSLRRLAEVAQHARALDRNEPTWQLLARVLLHQQGYLWLDFAASHSAEAGGVDAKQRHDWCMALSALVEQDRKALSSSHDAIVLRFLGPEVEQIEAGLRRLTGATAGKTPAR